MFGVPIPGRIYLKFQLGWSVTFKVSSLINKTIGNRRQNENKLNVYMYHIALVFFQKHNALSPGFATHIFLGNGQLCCDTTWLSFEDNNNFKIVIVMHRCLILCLIILFPLL